MTSVHVVVISQSVLTGNKLKFKPPRGLSIMKCKLLVTSLLAAIAIPVLAQTTAPADPGRPDSGQIRREQRDINQDRRDIGRDQRDLNQERRERNFDQRKEDQAVKRGDTKDAQKWEGRREQEQREISKEKRDIANDRSDMRKDRKERTQGMRRRDH